jgi:hypothetical protein
MPKLPFSHTTGGKLNKEKKIRLLGEGKERIYNSRRAR